MILAGKAARVSCLALLVGAALPAGATAAPSAGAAFEALGDSVFNPAGDLLGAGGLLAAGLLGLAGDSVGLVDRNRFTRPVLHGALSGLVDRLAQGVSWGATGALEGLRREDIERLPEYAALYAGAAPGRGHLDSILTGVAALELAFEDLLLSPPLALAHATGWDAASSALGGRLEDSRTRALGPLAAP